MDRSLHLNTPSASKTKQHLLAPILLIACCLLPLVILIWYTNARLEGSVEKLCSLIASQGFFNTLYAVWHPYLLGTVTSWKIFLVFITAALLLFKFLPGRPSYASEEPISKANGLFVFFTMIGLYFLSSCVLGLFPAAILYDQFPGLLATLNLFSLFYWIFSFIKAKWTQSEGTINLFTICRCAMIGWGLTLFSFAAKQYTLYGGLADSLVVSLVLQSIFIIKFFWWEKGYLRALEITYDPKGFCLCWGSIVWIPAIYTSPALYLVQHPHQLGALRSALLFFCGASCIFINFLVDRQRHYVRNKQGNCLVWRKKPELIFANYKTEWGEEKQNLLLVSGWWGLSRHFHYIPEFLGAFFWSVPALFDHFLPYFYLSFLALLLVDRAYRQERRCSMKYGKDWEKYCEKVPFRIIPFIY